MLLLGSTLIESVIGSGFAPLSRRHRYLPIVSLGVALFAAFGATDLYRRLRLSGRLLQTVFWVVPVLLIAFPSPLLASLAYPREINPQDIVSRALISGSQGFLEELETQGRGICTVAASTSLGDEIFAYSGHRLVAIALGQKLEENPARVRWRDVYEVTESWETRLADNRALSMGGVNVRDWRRLVASTGSTLLSFPSVG